MIARSEAAANCILDSLNAFAVHANIHLAGDKEARAARQQEVLGYALNTAAPLPTVAVPQRKRERYYATIADANQTLFTTLELEQLLGRAQFCALATADGWGHTASLLEALLRSLEVRVLLSMPPPSVGEARA